MNTTFTVTYYNHLIKSALIVLLICLTGGPVFSQIFSDVTNEMGIAHDSRTEVLMGGGVAFVDINNDGWEDLYLTGGNLIDRIYLNNEGTSFEELVDANIAETANRVTNSVSVGDINNDGFMDLFVGTGHYGYLNNPDVNPFPEAETQLNFLFLNNGDNTFTDITPQTIIQSDTAWTIASTFGDFNLDGYLDLYVGNYVHYSTQDITDEYDNFVGFFYQGYQDKLYLNDGNLGFVEVSENYGVNNFGPTLAAAATDYNFDHIPDIYVANDFGQWNVPNTTYQNQYPTESFVNVSEESGMDLQMFGMGIAIGDIDQDGDFDYYITNIGRNVLMLNDGNNVFEDRTTEAGVENHYADTLLTTGWGCAFADFNNNTFPDLVVSNGYIQTVEEFATNIIDPNKFYLNNGDGTFEDISDQSNFNFSGINRGLAIADYDKDGDLDIAVNNILRPDDEMDQPILYRNDLDNGHNWIKFSLQGTFNNLNAYGAKVMIYLDNTVLIREIDGGSSHASANSKIAHFGLGTFNTIDSCQVIWPGGLVQKISDYQINEVNIVIESDEDTFVESVEMTSQEINGLIKHQNLFVTHPDHLGESYIQLFDLGGQLLFEREMNLSGKTTNIFMPISLKKGEYLLNITSKGKKMTSKLLYLD